MTVTTQHPLDQLVADCVVRQHTLVADCVVRQHTLVAAVEAAKTARNAYLDNHDYHLVERRGVTYAVQRSCPSIFDAVHPDYVELFSTHYNASIKGGWFGEGYGSPTWAAIIIG